VLVRELASTRRSTHQSIRLSNLFRRLLETALSLIYLAIAAVNVMLHIAQVVEVKPPPALLICVCLLVLGLESFIVDLGTGAEFVLCVREEIVGAVANKVRAADLGVGDAELRRALVRAAHELLAHELFYRTLGRLSG
jgi:hypothetical protein